MGMCTSANKNANAYAERLSMGEFPHISSLSYGGKFNEYYYGIMQKEDEKTLSAEVENASFINPINGKNENYVGILTKSKYDGVGRRDLPIDIVIALDISGSMSGRLGNSSECCLSLAKTSIKKIVEKLNPEDRIGLCTFQSFATTVFPLMHVPNKEEIYKKIDPIVVQGGTELFPALEKAYEIMKCSHSQTTYEGKREKRLVFLTDMGDISNEDRFFTMIKEISEKEHIYLTIVGIGYNFNEASALKIGRNRGANFFCCTKETHLDEHLVKEFDYNFFPIGYNVFLKFSSVNFDVSNTYGPDYKPQKTAVDAEWFPDNHKNYDINFRKTIGLLAMLYKRRNNRIPKPIISNLANYLNSGFSTLNEINTMNPSLNEEINGYLSSKGALLLVKLKPKNEKKTGLFKDDCTVTFTYDDHFGTNSVCNLDYNFIANNENYFSSESIQKGVSVYLGMKLLRYMVKFAEKMTKGCELEELKATISKTMDFIKVNCVEKDIYETYATQTKSLFTQVEKKYEALNPKPQPPIDEGEFSLTTKKTPTKSFKKSSQKSLNAQVTS